MRVRMLALALGVISPTLSLAAWTVVNLHPSGPFESLGQAVDATYQVGFVNVGSYHAALWSGTGASFVDLHPAGASSSRILGMGGGVQVGSAIVGGLSRASKWNGTAASWVDLNPPGFGPSVDYGVSGNIQVGSITSGGNTHACLWAGSAGSVVDIHPTGSTQSAAVAVSGGTQVGYATVGLFTHASKWMGSSASWVDLNPSGATSSAASCIANGKIGGQATFDGDTHGGYWTGTAASWVDLHPAGARLSRVSGITDTKQVGDFIPSVGSNRAAIWSGTAASMVDLHAVLPGSWDYSFAKGVFESGGTLYVVGYGENTATGRVEAILWRQTSPDDFEFVLNKTQVAGQNSVQGTISATPISSARVYTTYDNSSLVQTPASVTLAANASVKNFQITVTAVTSTINTTMYARYGSITRSQPLALIPLVPTALAFTPSQVTGGQTISCRVVINGVAGPGGRTIAVFDNSPNTSMPSSVVVPAGATQVIFNISTTAVTSQKTVLVTARVSAAEKAGTFRINP